jgi:hypothetical protein
MGFPGIVLHYDFIERSAVAKAHLRQPQKTAMRPELMRAGPAGQAKKATKGFHKIP